MALVKPNKEPITGVTTLRKRLVELYNDLELGRIKTSEAKELANVAGKILNAAKVELEYNALLGINKKIDFLDDNPNAEIRLTSKKQLEKV